MSIKVLTVDDSKTIRLVVAKALKPFDCAVLEAENGVVGLAVASREKPDIIILDYTMPVMDGFEFLARLRSEPALKATPVIMLTAEAGRDTVTRIAKLGVRDYLIKPFKGDLLAERVGRIISLNPAAMAAEKHKRFDDPVHLLVVDDKPAIAGQVRIAIADTAWKVSTADQPGQALDRCIEHGADIVLASLSLPNDGAFLLFQNLRGYAKTATVPLLGLSVRTAAAEQTRALQTGFAGIVTKPIEGAELKSKVSRALRLETLYKYFQQCDGGLVLRLPADLNAEVANEISKNLESQLAVIVDAGGDKMIVDLNDVQTATVQVIETTVSAMTASQKLSLRCAVRAPADIVQQCRVFEDAQSWVFANSQDEAMTLLK